MGDGITSATIDAEVEKQTDAVAVKAYLTTQTKISVVALTKETWGTPDQIIESTAKLHGQTASNYRSSGLGDVAPVPIKVDEPVVIEK